MARIADAFLIRQLVESGDEFPMMCGAAASAFRGQDHAFLTNAHALASDDRWRIREGVAIGLQLLGDTMPSALTSIELTWADDPDPLVQRAATAAICEPRLLHTPESAAVAITVCQRTTGDLQRMPIENRRTPAVQALRRALGYCWSVAVAADPLHGLPAFAALDTNDADIDGCDFFIPVVRLHRYPPPSTATLILDKTFVLIWLIDPASHQAVRRHLHAGGPARCRAQGRSASCILSGCAAPRVARPRIFIALARCWDEQESDFTSPVRT